MSKKPTDEQLAREREALTGIDAVIAELVDQRGEMKICFDEEDGWFVMFNYFDSPPLRSELSWVALDHDHERHASPSAAIEGARVAHNRGIELLNYRGGMGAAGSRSIIPEPK